MMNGAESLKKVAIKGAKQVAQVTQSANANGNGNGGKKRRKGQDLKPIITTEAQESQGNSPTSNHTFQYS
jgi:serine/threonine-protein kinase SRPK3